jgi:uncharacterized protein (DUF1501 family)
MNPSRRSTRFPSTDRSAASRELSRRRFIGTCCAAVGATGLLSALAQLRLIGAVAGASSPSGMTLLSGGDYKALVCLFLSGGNDANNLLVPADPGSYTSYATGRGALALARETLLPIAPRTSDGRTWGLHPAMPELRDLFVAGRAAVLANVGTLVVPVTKAQYQARSVPLPPQLFSHNDQTVQWQSSLPDKPFQTGWGGRLADLVQAFNENNTVSMSISLAGQNAFQVGRHVTQYAVNPNGAVTLAGMSGNAGAVRRAGLQDLLTMPQDNLFETAFAGLTGGAIADSALLGTVLSGAAPFSTQFPATNLGAQLRTIARLIAARQTLGLRRQVFFARVGGWDLHDAQLTAHADLLGNVSRCLRAFYDATVELGVAQNVTTFTASDFGRTYNTNGDGSDHGWGSHHLIVGGAVRGGDLYGRMPELAIGGPDDTGRGRWIPTTSVDEYAATLARWFGVSATDLPVVLPNIGRFARPDLGFMA